MASLIGVARRRLYALLRALAHVAGEGQAPTATAAGVVLGLSPAMAGVLVSDAVKIGLIIRGEMLKDRGDSTMGGPRRLLWPGPAAEHLAPDELSPEQLRAWLQARQTPPDGGVVTLHLDGAPRSRRVVDGVALGERPGEDWRLLRGGVAVRESDAGERTRWEVVDG